MNIVFELPQLSFTSSVRSLSFCSYFSTQFTAGDPPTGPPNPFRNLLCARVCVCVPSPLNCLKQRYHQKLIHVF